MYAINGLNSFFSSVFYEVTSLVVVVVLIFVWPHTARADDQTATINSINALTKLIAEGTATAEHIGPALEELQAALESKGLQPDNRSEFTKALESALHAVGDAADSSDADKILVKNLKDTLDQKFPVALTPGLLADRMTQLILDLDEKHKAIYQSDQVIPNLQQLLDRSLEIAKNLDVEKDYKRAFDLLEGLSSWIKDDNKSSKDERLVFKKLRAEGTERKYQQLHQHAMELTTVSNAVDGEITGLDAQLKKNATTPLTSAQLNSRVALAEALLATMDENQVVSTLNKLIDSRYYTDDLQKKTIGLLDIVNADLDASNTAGEPRHAEYLLLQHGVQEAATEADSEKRLGNSAILKALFLLEPLNASPRINVIEAKFGRLRGHRGRETLCQATTAMRSKCNREESCGPPGTAGKFHPAELCGFDPAPDARGLARGLVVSYSCHRGGSELWNQLVLRPTRDPETGEVLNWRHPKVRTVKLYSSSEHLICTHPQKGG